MKAQALVVFLVGCTGDFGFVPDEKVPPAQPPGTTTDTKGEAPDWASCFQGWRGVYYNLRVTDDYVAPRAKDPPAPTEPDGFDYWEQPEAFEQFDASLDFGQNWWPVDQGLEGDPKYFAVHWDAWIRGDGGDFVFTLGSQDDSWVYINGSPIASKPGIQPFVRDTFSEDIGGGQAPIDIWFIHRGSETSAFSFRPIGGDVRICYPDFGTPTD